MTIDGMNTEFQGQYPPMQIEPTAGQEQSRAHWLNYVGYGALTVALVAGGAVIGRQLGSWDADKTPAATSVGGVDFAPDFTMLTCDDTPGTLRIVPKGEELCADVSGTWGLYGGDNKLAQNLVSKQLSDQRTCVSTLPADKHPFAACETYSTKDGYTWAAAKPFSVPARPGQHVIPNMPPADPYVTVKSPVPVVIA